MTAHALEGRPCNCGQPGWLAGIEHIPTAAYTAQTITPRGVLSHIMQGYQRTMIAWANERPARTRASAHFTIGRDGRTVQHVSIQHQAWHAGRLDASPPTWPLWRAGENPSDISIGIEHEGFSVPPGYGYDYLYSAARPWPEPMVLATIRVHRWLFAELGLTPGPNTAIGHYMTAPQSRANDPGPQWPRARIIAALADQEDEMSSNAYIVSRGDTLGAIAQRFGVTVAQLVAWNGIANANNILVGQVLRLTPDAPLPAAPNLDVARNLARQTREAVEAALTAAHHTERELNKED